PLGNALVLTAEDGLADTVRPRLDLMGGEPRRVWAIQAVKDGAKERLLNLQGDLGDLEKDIRDTDAMVVVIDPLSAYLGNADSFKDTEVRRALAPVASMAERTGVAIVAILHMSKDSERRAIYRALGSVAFSAAPRAVFAVGTDPDDENRRLFVPIKM